MSPVRTWDNTQAISEGWIVNSDCRIAFTIHGNFLSARQATDHVTAQAIAGSAYHIRALAVIAAQDLTAGLSWIIVSGSYGSFKACLDTGEVFDLIKEDEEDYSYADIIKVDVAEVKLNFPDTKHGDEWDVTQIGCWYDDGSYEGPASGRQCWLDNIDHEDDHVRLTRASLVLKPYTVTMLATVPVWRVVDVMAPNIEEAKQMVELGETWTIQGRFQPIDVDPDLLSEIETEVELITAPAPAVVYEDPASRFISHPGLMFHLDGDCTNIGVVDAPAAVNLRDWSHLSDRDGIKLYGSDDLLSFIQRIVDPSRWQFLSEDERTFLRQAAG